MGVFGTGVVNPENTTRNSSEGTVLRICSEEALVLLLRERTSIYMEQRENQEELRQRSIATYSQKKSSRFSVPVSQF